jgi:YD repeat-containing protein
MMHFYIRREFQLLIVLASAITLASPALAQVQPTDMNLDTGIKPYDTFDRAQENVNIGSGNLNIQIPLVHLPGRNGHDFDLTLTYNSQNWSPTASLYNSSSSCGYDGTSCNVNQLDIAWQYAGQQTNYELGSTGWQLNIPVLYATGVTVPPSCIYSPGGCHYPLVSSITQTASFTNFYLVMGDGRKYQFPFASFLNWQSTTTLNSGNMFYTLPAPYSDILIDYDNSTSKYLGGPGAEGVMLDLTNAANGTGTAVVRFRDGTQILFDITPGQFPTPTPGNGPAATATGTIALPASALVNSNGNVINIGLIKDTLGRSITLLPFVQNGGTGGVQYSDSNGVPSYIYFNYAQFPASVMPVFNSPAVNQSGGIMSVVTNQIMNMLSSVTLPDNLQYTFQYNAYGEITEITYPSGGYTRYTYQAFPVNEYAWSTAISGFADNRQVVEKDTCPGQSTVAPSPGYSSSLPVNTCTVAEDRTTYTQTSRGVAVVDPLNNETDYIFGGASCSPYPSSQSNALLNYAYGVSSLEVSRSVYQGQFGSGKLLRTVYTNYYDACHGNLKTSEVTVLPNQQWSEKTWTYDTAPNYYQAPTLDELGYQTQVPASAETDNMLIESDYGFGQGPSPPPPTGTGQPVQPALPLLRRTVNSYLATNPYNGINYQQVPIYILNRLLDKAVQNSNGYTVAETSYSIDNYYPAAISPSGAVQHGTSLNAYGSNYTTRGNVTYVYDFSESQSGNLWTQYQYDDAGNVLVKIDSAGNQTHYSYANSWHDSTCAPPSSQGVAAAYPTSITNALGQTTHYSWNSCSGTMASATDPNLQTTTFNYDLMDRRVLANYPDGGQTSLQYSDDQNTSLPIQITTTKKLNSTQNEVSTTTLDGLSRVVQTQLTTDPYGADIVITTYDPAGNVQCATNPFRSTGDSTYGVTCYQYDALHRKTIQTDPGPGGYAKQWCYDNIASTGQTNCHAQVASGTGTWVDVADEKMNDWQQTFDGLGRLTSVAEPNGSGQAPSMQTSYTYDALNNLLTAVQSGNGSGSSVSRSFSYDGFSRLITANNPETGTVGYTYDADGNVLTKTDARGVTTTYTYDALNRLLSKTYSDTSTSKTPWSCYQYDSSSVTNGIGRLSNAWTQSSGTACPTTAPSTGFLNMRSILSYDPMGRIWNEKQYTLANQASGTPYNLVYTYDLAGNMLTSTSGVGPTTPIQFTNAYDGAGRLQTLSSNWTNNSVFPTTLFSAQTGSAMPCPNSSSAAYAPFGGFWNATFGNGLVLNRAYDNRLRTTCETDTGTGTTAATPGSATVTITGSEQTQ